MKLYLLIYKFETFWREGIGNTTARMKLTEEHCDAVIKELKRDRGFRQVVLLNIIELED